MKKHYEMHVISHSHWDREWRYSFAESRLKLVEMMDRLLEVLARYPNYKHYHLDSQTILLEDYLEIRPEMEGKLKDHIRKGRILVGPWYTLPEEFMVSGESLIRNLLIGGKIARKFGRVMKVGYTPTSCGQVSQLPQIYGGFGIDSILFYRGINPHDARSEFWWESPDGTRALTCHFYTWGRANFFSVVFYPVLLNGWREISGRDAQRHFYLPNQPYPYLLDVTSRDSIFHGDQLIPALTMIRNDAVAKATTRFLLYMDGCDTGAPHPFTPRIIRQANQQPGSDKYFHSNLPDYMKKLRKAVRNLEVLKGEMRHAGKDMSNAVFPGLLSSRLYLKQLNARAEYTLAGRAEPWSVIAWLLGGEYPKGQLENVWKSLLANHAHDSIQACSADRVADDMEYRFAQCDQMAHGILRRSLGSIARSMPLIEENEYNLMVFNCLPHRRSGVILTVLTFPAKERMTTTRFNDTGSVTDTVVDVPESERMSTFSIYDGAREIPHRIVSRETRKVLREQLELNTQEFDANRFTVHLYAQDIPAMGFKSLRVISRKSTRGPEPGLVKAPGRMENEFLSVKINRDGRLTVNDKTTGKTFDNLHVFEDGGEVGNSINHQVPEKDERVLGTQGKVRITLKNDDPLMAVYEIETRLSVPERAAADKKSRGSRKKELNISSTITLKRGSKWVEIVSRFDNRINDHRLRVLFPSGIGADVSSAGGQMDVIQRPIKSVFQKDFFESKITDHPQYSFVDVSDGKVGLAVLNQGLTEYEVVDDRLRTIALTLVRSFDKIGCGTEGCDNFGGQCLRKIECRYALYPHAGDYQKGNVFQEAQRFNLPLEAAQSGRRGGPFGDNVSFFRIEPETLILSALKQSETGKSVVVRFFNPTLRTVRGKVTCFHAIEKAWTTNLNEERQKKLKVKDGYTVVVEAKPKKIITLELMLSERR